MELREIHEIRDDDSLQPEFAEYIDEVTGGCDDFIGTRQDEFSAAETVQVIASFSTAIVNDTFFPEYFGDEPGRRWGKQKRPVGRREDMRNIDSSQVAPEMQKVDGLA